MNTNKIKVDGEINNTFHMNFLHQYSQFNQTDNIDIEITTIGGDFYIAYLISQIIQKHKGTIQVIIPYHVLSCGSIIALSSDKIILSN
jgi:ATP-dependent protease ClpP protease subunit